jgi:hypothetical protein
MKYKIALSGLANSGKNTCSGIIVNALNCEYNVHSADYLAFADPIKEMAQLMFPQIPRQWLWGPSKLRQEIIPEAHFNGKAPLTVRQLLLDLGTQGRSYNPDCWVNVFDARLQQSSSSIVIAMDVRFANELEYLKRHGFYTIRLLRPNNDLPMINHLS